MNDLIKAASRPLRSFYCSIPVSGYLPGSIADWPPRIQEPLLECLERIQQRNGIDLEIVQSFCRKNPEGFSLVVEAIEDRSKGFKIDGKLIPWSDVRV